MMASKLPPDVATSSPPSLFECFPEFVGFGQVPPPGGTTVPSGYMARDDVVMRHDGTLGEFVYDSGSRAWVFTTSVDVDHMRDHAVEISGTRALRVVRYVPVGEPVVDSVPVVKRECAVCGFVVNPIGHSGVGGRCEVSGSAGTRGGTWSGQRRIAWVADAMLAADVRLGLMLSGTADENLGFEFGRLTNAEYQAGYLASVADRSWLVSPTGSSLHNSSTAFECNYARQDFRVMFLRSIFSADVVDCVTSRIRLFDLSGLTSAGSAV